MSYQIVKRNKRYYELTSRNIALIPTNKAVCKKPQLWFSLTKNVTNYNTLFHIMHIGNKVQFTAEIVIEYILVKTLLLQDIILSAF